MDYLPPATESRDSDTQGNLRVFRITYNTAKLGSLIPQRKICVRRWRSDQARDYQHSTDSNEEQKQPLSTDPTESLAFGLRRKSQEQDGRKVREETRFRRQNTTSILCVDEYQPLLGKDRVKTPSTVDIRSLLKVPDSNESSYSPPNQSARARSASAPAPPPPAAAAQSAAVPASSPATTATLAPAAAIYGGRQQIAGVAPAVGTLYAAPAAPPPLGPYPFLGGGGYAPAGAFLGGGGGPGPVSADPRGPLSIGPGPGPVPGASKRSMPPHTAESPAKKQSKWSPEEDALIIELRGSGMKWEDISKRLPGRSAISCRLHYQNYLERRSEWDEERKNKLARLYER